jgi:N-acetylmuramoyl-L-alanine amidase
MTFDTLTWHYTATYEDQDIGAAEIDRMHRARGWSGIGYHRVVRLDGRIEEGRPLTRMGSHVLGQNARNLGLVYIGGLRRVTGPDIGADTRTDRQKEAMAKLTRDMLARFPTIKRIVGHMDLAATQCPGFNVGRWWGEVNGIHNSRPSPIDIAKPVVSYPVLRRGSRGNAVVTLQRELANLGFAPRGGVDGIFGPATDDAVRRFQISRRIANDGIVGPATWAEIYRSK